MVGFRLGNKVYRITRQADRKGSARVKWIAFFHLWKQAWEPVDSKDFPMDLPPRIIPEYTRYEEYKTEAELNEAISQR